MRSARLETATVLVLATVLIGSLMVVRLLSSGDSSPAGRAAPAAGGSPPAGGASPRGGPPRQLADGPGSYTESTFTASGDIRVSQWIRTEQPTAIIQLVAPTRGKPVWVTGLRIVADDVAVRVPPTIRPPGVLYHLPFATLIHFRYVLHGAVDRSPSADGRALARIAYLNTIYESQTGPSWVEMLGPHVLNAACATRPTEPRPCGSPAADRWTVQLPGARRNDSVMAQLDLS